MGFTGQNDPPRRIRAYICIVRQGFEKRLDVHIGQELDAVAG